MPNDLPLRGCVLLCYLVLVSCATVPKHPVDAEIFNENIKTSVDSSIAKYYIEHYLQGRNADLQLHQTIDVLYANQNGKVPSRKELKIIAEQYSVDFAALFYADHLYKKAENRTIQTAFSHYFKNGEILKTLQAASEPAYLVLFVPGWDYIENGHLTGADFAVPRKLIAGHGVENYLVNIPPHGSVEENATIITHTIKKHRQRGKPIVIVGASSAGPAIYLSLAKNNGNPEFSHVKGWLNLGGILKGSPLIDYYQQWPQHWLFDVVVWFKGWDKENIATMSARQSHRRLENLGGISNDILIINYMGLSLSGQLSPYSEDLYPILVPEGPNDGLTYLPDMVAPNSLTIIAPNSDHFFAEDPKINEKTIALMKVVIAYLENNYNHKTVKPVANLPVTSVPLRGATLGFD